MILHRDGSTRRSAAEPRPSSVPELARVLRQARAARGLELFAVSQQTSIPLDLLHDLESGTVDRLPDRVAILKALSRYANFLNLPADQFVMTLVEHWPTAPSHAMAAPNGRPASSGVIATPAPPPAAPSANDLSTRAIPISMPETASIPTSALGLPKVTEGRHATTAPVPIVMADTGRTPVVRRGNESLLVSFIRGLAVVITILIAVGVAWLVINRVRPQWLADLHIPYTSSGVGASSAGATHTPTTHATTHTTAPAKPAMTLVSANGSQATFSVTAPLFTVKVSASGGDTWVKATGPLSTKPEFEGIVKAGQFQALQANHQLVVEIGSTAARMAIQVGHTVIGTYVPPGAPFTMTFTTK